MGQYYIFLAILFSAAPLVNCVRCIECSQMHFNGEANLDDCYNLQKLSTTEDSNCEMADSDAYCYTKIELSDGFLSFLERGCTNPKDDPLYASDEIPDSMKCHTSYAKGSDNIHQTECYLPCKGDVCNAQRFHDQFKACPEACPSNTECNYLTGKCQCAPNKHGANCTVNAHSLQSHSCVQCNSHTHPDCGNMNEGTRCQNGEMHCSTTQTWILKPDGTVDSKPVITRSCTNQYVSPDRCYLTETSDISSAKYTEYTCVSTCSSPNCNNGTANGDVDEEFIPMKCVVCEGDEAICGPSRVLTSDCPRGTTHCMSSVTYWETVVKDSKLQGRLRPEPSISVRSIKRGCASGPVNTDCRRNRVGFLNMYEVTCTENCTEDGCNNGWPARPKCVKCDNIDVTSKGKACLYNPPSSEDCPGPHHEHCFTQLSDQRQQALYTADGDDKFTIIRGCSKYKEDQERTCKNITEFGRVLGVECSNYCQNNGCNFANFEVIEEITEMYSETTSDATRLKHHTFPTWIFIAVNFFAEIQIPLNMRLST